MKSLVCDLKLTFPPMSNQETNWLSKDKDVQQMISSSNLYMLGQREEVFFDLGTLKQEGSSISFCIKNSKVTSDRVFLDFSHHGKEIFLEIGKKIIKILDKNEVVTGWFTPDRVLQFLSHDSPLFSVDGKINFDDFFKIKLLYIGISKANDSLTRLFLKPHGTRADILSDSVPIRANARVTDEIMIYFFDFDYINLNSTQNADEVEGFLSYESDKTRIISDAEKALIRVMNPPFNKEKYSSYPKSTDGLASENLDGYSFSIKEELTFFTEDNCFKGSVKGEGSFITIKEGEFNFFD